MSSGKKCENVLKSHPYCRWGGPAQAKALCGLQFLPPSASEVWVQRANEHILQDQEELGRNTEDYTGNTGVSLC